MATAGEWMSSVVEWMAPATEGCLAVVKRTKWMSLCDDVWEVRLHFHDRDNLERSMCVSDITFLNLIALIETAGYGEGDYMYYVKNAGLGVAGLEEICDDDKIDEMLDHIASKDQTIVNLIVARGTEPRPGDLNIGHVYEQHVPICNVGERAVYEEARDVHMDDGNAGDVNLEKEELERTMELKRKNKIERFKKNKKSVERVEAIKGKLHVLLTQDDSDLELDEDFMARMAEMRRQRHDPLLHFECVTDVEEFTRSHASLEQVFEDVWEPSSDEDPNPGDLKEEEDDGAVPLQFVLGNKSRAKIPKPRIWYDEDRDSPELQFVKKLCFESVYQFRRALLTFHIAQNRNYQFHRNCNDRIIAVCRQEQCPFFIAASVVAKESTFCIRKSKIVHTCPAVAESTKVITKWDTHELLEAIRTDLNTSISTIMQNLKTKTKTKTAKWDICPTYVELLEEAKKHSRKCQALMVGPSIYQVTSNEKTYPVNLQQRTCGYRKWDMTAVSCNHVVSAMTKAKVRPEDFVHDFFKKPMYLAAYNPIIYHVPGQDLWPKTKTRDIEPPVFKDKPRKKQTKRRRGQFEPPKPKDTSRMVSITCSNCQLVGHRYTSCQKTLKPILAMRKNKHEDRGGYHTRKQGTKWSTKGEGSGALGGAAKGAPTGATSGAPRGATSGAPRGAATGAASTTTIASSTAQAQRRASSAGATRASTNAVAARKATTVVAIRRATTTATIRRAASAAASRRASTSTAAIATPFLPPRQRKKPSKLKDYFYASRN
ncbi:translation initiation factor IF-2-like [Hordeum vulgare]|nr:translation initiation factor IF-2-like [Hordeum vulgare]